MDNTSPNPTPENNPVTQPSPTTPPTPQPTPTSTPPAAPAPTPNPAPAPATPTTPIAPAGIKSATVAGLLGIFLGGVGAHNWYLGEKQKGIIHCCLAGGGLLLTIIIDFILPLTMSTLTILELAGLFSILNAIITIVQIGNGIWALVEAIQILTGGDAALAAKGYAVAAPAIPAVPTTAPAYPPQQPMQPTQPTQPAQPVQPTQPTPSAQPVNPQPADHQTTESAPSHE